MLDQEAFYALFDVLAFDWTLDAKQTFKHSAGAHTSARTCWARVRAQIRVVVRSFAFELATQLAILANAIVVIADAASAARGTPPSVGIMAIFFLLFLVEAILKIVAFGWKHYMAQRWNRFDFALVCISFSGLVVQAFLSAYAVPRLGVTLRTLRLLRFFRIRASYRHVLSTMAILLRQLGRYLAVLLCVDYVFAILGAALLVSVVGGIIAG